MGTRLYTVHEASQIHVHVHAYMIAKDGVGACIEASSFLSDCACVCSSQAEGHDASCCVW